MSREYCVIWGTNPRPDYTTRSENRLQALEQRVSNVMGLSAEMSMAVNDIQLKSEGLSPLQKHFGPILMTRLADRR